MRNFMMRGPAGTGKTKGAEAAAAGFGLPYVYITCSANTEITDLLGQILPDVKTGFDSQPEQSASCSVLPAYEDIQMDPATAYCTLTGEYMEDITAEAVYGRLIETIQNNAAKRQNDGNRQGFRYIDTPLVDAMRYGWVCELQEPSIIANPGVLVGLNAMLDSCGTVTLPTGEVIQRHPDTVIIVTTNDDYNGCKKMNQSVISRMDLVFDVDEPDIGTLVGRVMKITKCGDESIVRQMAETVKDISKHCRQEMITDGCCGARELIAWVQSYMISGNALESAGYTILPSVSANPENRAEIRQKCLEPKYAA
jgi:MoxR-like ATPase